MNNSIINNDNVSIFRNGKQVIIVINEPEDEEVIDFNSLFGKCQIRQTVRESNDRRQLFEQFIELSAKERTASRMSNSGRIELLNIFADEIDKMIHDDTNREKAEQEELLELLIDIYKEIIKLSNKANGGYKSNMTRRVRELQEENQQLREKIALNEDDFYFIDKSGFSANYMYSWGNNGKVIKSAAYCRWINNLHLEEYLPQEYPDVDFTQPLRITILFGKKTNMDTNNLGKAIIDQIADYYDFDDVLVHETLLYRHDDVNSYDDGYMYVRIENI